MFARNYVSPVFTTTFLFLLFSNVLFFCFVPSLFYSFILPFLRQGARQGKSRQGKAETVSLNNVRHCLHKITSHLFLRLLSCLCCFQTCCFFNFFITTVLCSCWSLSLFVREYVSSVTTIFLLLFSNVLFFQFFYHNGPVFLLVLVSNIDLSSELTLSQS